VVDLGGTSGFGGLKIVFRFRIMTALMRGPYGVARRIKKMFMKLIAALVLSFSALGGINGLR
jgi:hypothetical protein